MNATDKAENKTVEITTYFWKTCGPIIFILGLTGNFTAMWIFRKLKFTSSTTYLHLFVLAITDSAVLINNLGRLWIKYTFDYDVRNVSGASCKIHEFLAYVLPQLSGWILVSLSVERLTQTYFPFQFHSWCTIRRVIWKLIIIILLSCVLNNHLLWTYELNDKSECEVVENNSTKCYDDKVFVWLNLLFLSLFPFVIMITCSVLIIRKLKHSGLVYNPNVLTISLKGPNTEDWRNVDRNSPETRILVFLAILYACLSFPNAVMYVIYELMSCSEDEDGNCKSVIHLVWTITYLILCCNYAINSLVYIRTIKKFKKEFLKMFRRRSSRWHSQRTWTSTLSATTLGSSTVSDISQSVVTYNTAPHSADRSLANRSFNQTDSRISDSTNQCGIEKDHLTVQSRKMDDLKTVPKEITRKSTIMLNENNNTSDSSDYSAKDGGNGGPQSDTISRNSDESFTDFVNAADNTDSLRSEVCYRICNENFSVCDNQECSQFSSFCDTLVHVSPTRTEYISHM